MTPTNWSVSDLHKMPEGEWRTYLCLRLDSIEDQLSASGDMPKRVDVIERRCSARAWQGKVMWAALLASVGLILERIWRGHA